MDIKRMCNKAVIILALIMSGFRVVSGSVIIVLVGILMFVMSVALLVKEQTIVNNK